MTYRSKIYKIAAVWLYSRLPATFYLWFTHRYKTTPINYWLIVIQNWQWRFMRTTSRKQRQRDMEKKFNIGDRVRLKSNGSIVEVVLAKDGWIAYDETRRIAGSCPMEEAEPIDPKTAFLSDLADVLRKHNAVMDIAFWYKCVGIMITIPNEKLLLPISTEIAPASQTWLLGEYSHTPITADNIMDYKKE